MYELSSNTTNGVAIHLLSLYMLPAYMLMTHHNTPYTVLLYAKIKNTSYSVIDNIAFYTDTTIRIDNTVYNSNVILTYG